MSAAEVRVRLREKEDAASLLESPTLPSDTPRSEESEGEGDEDFDLKGFASCHPRPSLLSILPPRLSLRKDTLDGLSSWSASVFSSILSSSNDSSGSSSSTADASTSSSAIKYRPIVGLHSPLISSIHRYKSRRKTSITITITARWGAADTDTGWTVVGWWGSRHTYCASGCATSSSLSVTWPNAPPEAQVFEGAGSPIRSDLSER